VVRRNVEEEMPRQSGHQQMPMSISKAQKLNEAKKYIIKVNRMVAIRQNLLSL